MMDLMLYRNLAVKIMTLCVVAVLVTNHAGGILGGISNGNTVVLRCAVKPTPSIAQKQQTVTVADENIDIEIHGRHDPCLVPRVVVVAEAMCALVIADMLRVSGIAGDKI